MDTLFSTEMSAGNIDFFFQDTIKMKYIIQWEYLECEFNNFPFRLANAHKLMKPMSYRTVFISLLKMSISFNLYQNMTMEFEQNIS